MHVVWIPPVHRDLTGGVEMVEVGGATIGQVIDQLESRFPGIKQRLCADNTTLRPGIAVAVDGVIARRGLNQRILASSEVHFVPALAGG